MADWLEWTQFCILSLIFAYMLRGLISIVQSFREQELRIERGQNDNFEIFKAEKATEEGLGFPQHERPFTTRNLPEEGNQKESFHGTASDALVPDASSPQLCAENAAIKPLVEEEDESLLSDEEDWEGIHGSDLDKTFGKATSYLEKMVLDPSIKISNETKLQFYGFFKQATEGPCSSPQPLAYRLSARAKWNAWKALGDISPEEGMQRYIALLSELYPRWNEDSKDDVPGGSKKDNATGSSRKGSRIGPVFSTMLSDPMEQEEFLEGIHKCAKEGNLAGLKNELSKNSAVIDQTDGDGRTALHWAADQGQLEIVKFLISQGADVNARDCEGQTSLHYATTCEWDEIIECLLQSGADPSLVDNDGCTPYEHSFSPGKEGIDANT